MCYLLPFLFIKRACSETSEEHARIPIAKLMKTREVSHPIALYTKEDVERARRNSAANKFASVRNNSINNVAKSALAIFTDEFIESFVPRTTPGSRTFCPHCHATGRNWHSSGDWKWDPKDPDHIKCNVCGMVFPNAKYPESIKITSTWDPEQTISYVNNGPVRCLGYEVCRSSLLGVIRGYKLNYFIKTLKSIAMGYQMEQNPDFAIAVKKGLLKLAERIPKYMVYAGYSYAEYCDQDPHEVVKDPSKCKKLINAPGNTRTQGLYDNYWAASRLGTEGMDGNNVYSMALSYDLTADAKDKDGKNIYSEKEKKLICENCLIESALLGFYDTDINNKAVTNRRGVGITGLATGNTILSRFGLDGFIRTVQDWFLPDGGTPESAAYALMTMGGVYEFGISFRNYSDPDDFVPPQGEKKYKNFDANTETVVDEAFQSLLWTSYGNYIFPPIADSYTTTTMGNVYADYLRMAFDTETVRNFVQEKSGENKVPFTHGFFLNDLTHEEQKDKKPVFEFPDVVFPYLSQGFIRTGHLGRDSLVVMDASNYGGHHHDDSLNLVYWKDGRELLNDLGYLWDHPNRSKTHDTNVHNTVVVDGENQIGLGRNGSFHSFYTNGNAKVMHASSNAYNQSSVYDRTVTQINHNSSSKNYIVDIFRVNGGEKREYVFHGVNHNYTMNQKLDFNIPYNTKLHKGCVRFYINKKGYIDISNVVLKPVNPDGSLGENMAKPLPAGAFKGGSKTCPASGTWCFYGGNNEVEIEAGNDGPNGEESIHFASAKPDKNGKFNVALNLGNTNGYKAPNALDFDSNTEYYLEFSIRGNVMPKIAIQYWKSGEESDPKSRLYSKFMKLPAGANINNKWQKFSGKLSLGQIKQLYGAEFEKELIIKWNIDKNYTFTSFTPKLIVDSTVKKQKVFFENGWGQRDYKNSDFGATLPYFYFSNDEKDKLTTFVNVYEGSPKGQGIVKGVRVKESSSGSVAIEVDTKEGKDYILSSFDGQEIKGFGLRTNAEIAVQIGEDANNQNGQISTPMMINGDYFTSVNQIIKGRKAISGNTISEFNEKKESWFEITSNEINLDELNYKGLSFEVKGECGSVSDIERAYPIRKIESIGQNRYRIYTRTDSVGFRAHCHKSWRIPYVAVAKNERMPPQPSSRSIETEEETYYESTSEEVIESTIEPTVIPTVEPTIEPTVEPTVIPTVEPTIEPTVIPTVEPTIEPTVIPTVEPTIEPTIEPTVIPTVEPTAESNEDSSNESSAETNHVPKTLSTNVVIGISCAVIGVVIVAIVAVTCRIHHKKFDTSESSVINETLL